MATILCAKEVPAVGGDTMFVSMTAAYEGLRDRMQQLISENVLSQPACRTCITAC